MLRYTERIGGMRIDGAGCVLEKPFWQWMRMVFCVLRMQMQEAAGIVTQVTRYVLRIRSAHCTDMRSSTGVAGVVRCVLRMALDEGEEQVVLGTLDAAP